MATITNPSKPPKAGGSTRRKISLPWFRQASIGEKLTRLRLPRQNTVDCHGSSSAPATAPVATTGGDNKISAAFRRKVLSGSASVEVNTMECLNWKKFQNSGWSIIIKQISKSGSIKITMGQFRIKLFSDSVFVSRQKCTSQPPQ